MMEFEPKLETEPVVQTPKIVFPLWNQSVLMSIKLDIDVD